MSNSKYSISYPAIWQMSSSELKTYIRSASKTLSKKIKSFQKLPFGMLSETLQYVENANSLWATGKSMFAAKGLTASELRDKAYFVTNLAGIDETASGFERETMEEIYELASLQPDDEGYEETIEYLTDPDNLDKMKYFAELNWNTIMSYIGSDEVNNLGREYEHDPSQFYLEVIQRALDRYEASSEKRYKFYTTHRR